MKAFACTLLFSAWLCGQTPQPPKVTPGTLAPPAPGQAPVATPPAEVPPDTVVAEVDGKKITAKEADEILASLPPQYQQAARLQPQQTLMQIFLFRHLADEAVKAGLDQKGPYKEALAFNRMTILYQAEVNDYRNRIPVSPEDEQKLYKEHPERFHLAQVKVIHLSFSATPDKPGADGKKPLSEAEAKAKLEDLRKQALAGADFGKLARENSDDKASAAKDGDFGTIGQNSPYPPAVKTAVFALKPGEISEPVKQTNGFYLIRLDSTTTQPFDEVRSQIVEEIRQTRFNEWVRGLQTRFAVKVENPAYFVPRRPPQLQPVK